MRNLHSTAVYFLLPRPPGKQKQQEQPAEELLEELRAKLKWTQEELEAQREAEKRRRLQVGVEGQRQRRSGLPRASVHTDPTGLEFQLVSQSGELELQCHLLGCGK